MKRLNIKLTFAALAAAFGAGLVAPLTASAATPAFGLDPFEYVGTAAECGVAGTDTVTAKWESGTILLQKLGATSNCAAAGVDIVTSLEGGPVSALTELNFDYKTGEHCGAGAPRFNVVTSGGTVFLGCASGTQTDAGNGYTHVVFDAAQIQAALTAASVAPTATLNDLYIIFDEGTDTPTGGTIGTAGTVHLDNISVNEAEVGSPTSPTDKDACKNGGYKNFLQAFKNQGDCVSYVATNGKNMPAAPKHVKL